MSQNKPEDITANDAINLIDEAEELYYKANKDSQDNSYYEAAEKLKKAIDILKQEKLDKSHQEDLAISYTNLGTLKLLLGQANDALENWQEATFIYEQLNNSTEVRNSLILQAKALEKLSFAPRACNILIEALGIETEKNQQFIQQEIDSQSDKESCQNVKFTPKMIQQVQQKFVNNNQSNYRKGLILLGNVLRKIGELNDSQIVLEETLKFSQEKTLQAAINFSLGDTLKAKGDLYYLRQSPPKYDYQPWKFYPRNLENSNNVQQKNQDTNRNCNNAQQCYQEANEKYQNAIKLAPSKEVYIKSQVKSLNLSLILGDINKAQELASNIKLLDLPKTVSTVYTKINYAKSLAYLQQLKPEPIDQSNIINQQLKSQQINQPNPLNLVEDAIKDAEEIKNEYCSLKVMDFGKQEKKELNSSKQYCLKYNRAESYALGNLGGLYEYLGDLPLAEEYTQKALYIAQPSEDPDLAYQWQWQLGRLFNAEEKKEEAIAKGALSAIAFYENAVKTLESVRGDLLAINTDVQFNFRDNVEPLYRELVDLLLKNEENKSSEDQFLWKSIYYIDSLQIAELENFLSCDLGINRIASINQDTSQKEPIELFKKRINKVSEDNPTAAFVYPIILKDRLEVIYKLPEEKWQHYSNYVSQDLVKKTLKQLRDEGLFQADSGYIIENAKSLYQWLIKPLNLNQTKKVDTLVFILDGELRNIPMGVLYNENKNEYLIEDKYALVVLPSANLFDLTPLQKETGVLAGGISEKLTVKELGESERKFDPLSVAQELQTISKEPLLNEKFTKQNLKQQIKSGNFSIIHLATHGNFSSDPQDTYILVYGSKKSTGELLRYNELEQLLQQSNQEKSKKIGLLVLSACKTAEGDNRATLGLAGLAVKAGASSTMATLWQVGDQATVEFMKHFYNELEKGVSKAKALHQAQKQLLNDPNYQNPKDWAAYILVGNWS